MTINCSIHFGGYFAQHYLIKALTNSLSPRGGENESWFDRKPKNSVKIKATDLGKGYL